MNDDAWVPVTFADCARVTGPFLHGTRAALTIGDLLVAGRSSNFEEGRVSNHVYFTKSLEAATWGAELATPHASGRGSIYVVEPTGPFEDDPNLTNKRFPGNVTASYRTREPLRIVGVVEDWEGHDEEAIRARLASLAELRRLGKAVIED